MKINKLIEINIETPLQDDSYYKINVCHMFSTDKDYTHEDLVKIMANINQKYYEEESYCVVGIDFKDLCNQLAEYEIYEIVPVERYYFDLERDY